MQFTNFETPKKVWLHQAVLVNLRVVGAAGVVGSQHVVHVDREPETVPAVVWDTMSV